MIFDAFEVSSSYKSVLSSGGLLRHFPGVSVAVPVNKLTDPACNHYLASSISQLASEQVKDMMPKTRKAGSEVDEHRGMIHPGLVTEGLMAQLLALETHNEEEKTLKCVRYEVNWHSTLLPSRRAPAWLLLRVALQIILRRCFPKAEGHSQYKNLIIYHMATIATFETKQDEPTNTCRC